MANTGPPSRTWAAARQAGGTVDASTASQVNRSVGAATAAPGIPSPAELESARLKRQLAKVVADATALIKARVVKLRDSRQICVREIHNLQSQLKLAQAAAADAARRQHDASRTLLESGRRLLDNVLKSVSPVPVPVTFSSSVQHPAQAAVVVAMALLQAKTAQLTALDQDIKDELQALERFVDGANSG